jgi:hypothetical protein
MALREFTDPDGNLWQIWNVRPTTRYSAPLVRAERRKRPAPHFYPERRSGGFSLTPGLEKGWLCFECADEKRRLIPTPRDWDTCGVEALQRYLKAAKPIRRRVVDQSDGYGAQPQPS